MKQTYRTYLIVLAVAAMLLSACGGVPAASPAEQAAVKVDASIVAFTGTVESISGNQWVVNGQSLTVDPAVIKDGPFQVGDNIKVEGQVNPDGSFTVSRVEMPSADDLIQLPQLGDDNSNANSNDNNSNDDNANINGNSNDDNANLNSNDDNSNNDNTNVNSNDDNSNDDNVNGNSNANSNSNGNDDSGGGGKDDNSGGGSGKDDNSGDDGGNSNDG